ncbi:MAG: S-layer homology domain-containing protein [Syntrophomonadaceae bacterium]|nr:S-layer homology domain-containing protein [Syntrophomonadaceae bacterium]
MIKRGAPRKKSFVFFLVILSLLLAGLISVSNPSPALADQATISEIVNGVVGYYRDHKTDLDNWQEVVALRGAGVDISQPPWKLPDWQIDSLNDQSPATDYASRILGLYAAGQDPADISGRNLVNELAGKQGEDGSFGGAVNNTIWAVIALDEAEADYQSEMAVAYLVGQQKEDGGFALSGDNGDPDLTGMALLALARHQEAPGVEDAIQDALVFLHSAQQDDGGFASNAESSASVIQGVYAVGEDPASASWQKDGRSIVDALLAHQLADNSFCHLLSNPVTNEIATRQALLALSSLGNGTVFYELKDKLPARTCTIRVRVEGLRSGLADETVTVSGTALDALKAAVGEGNVTAPGGFITSIKGESGGNDVAPDTDTSWMYYVIRDGDIETGSFMTGAGGYNVQDGDEVVFYIGAYDNKTWETKTFIPAVSVSPATPREGDTVTVRIALKKYDFLQGLVDVTDFTDIRVSVNGTLYQISSANPSVSITPPAGILTVQVEKDGAYPEIVRQIVTISVADSGPPVPSTIAVSIAVVGKNRLYYDGTVKLSPGERDAFHALLKTGLDVKARYNNTYVYEIEGEREDLSSTAGWKYKVNGVIPGIPAIDKLVRDGDEILWFWANTYSDTEPGKPLKELEDPKKKAVSQQAAEELTRIDNTLRDAAAVIASGQAFVFNVGPATVVVGGKSPMTDEERSALRRTLNDNQVNICQEAASSRETVIQDLELELVIPAGALTESKQVTVKELGSPGPGSRLAVFDKHRQVTPVYEFGPSGTRFNEPVTVSLNLVIPEDIDPENLCLAWYDEQRNRWVPVLAVLDLSNGKITAKLDHFTKFCVVVRGEQFADLGREWEWAQEAVSALSSRGVVCGVGEKVFAPQEAVTRAQFCKMMVLAMGLDTVATGTGERFDFSDVKDSDWHAGFVKAAVVGGIVKGYPDSTFKPDARITREEMAAIVVRAAGKEETVKNIQEKQIEEKLAFADRESISPWARGWVAVAADEKLISGFADNTFAALQNANRAQAAVIVHRVLP